MTKESMTRPYPVAGDWTEQARCATPDAPDFYVRASGRPGSDGKHPPVIARLIEFCNLCPVRLECLDYALACEDLDPYGGHGIWGGLTSRERNRLRRQRNQEGAA